MNRNETTELLKRYLNGDLTEAQAAECREQLEASSELRNEFESLRMLHQIVADSAGSFAPYFATRVMARLHSSTSLKPDFTSALNLLFKRFAAAAALMIISFASYNIVTQWEYRQVSTPLEMALALPPATVDSSINYLDFEE
ncbi:hypothetical protein KKG66_05265 [bacterium]|nr:hypothetical protein [bacterium]MBU1920233.1 hypothetical protein [bacterium]